MLPALPVDPAPYAAFIRAHLMQPLAPDAGAPRAVAETELAVAGDRWFWADDNAKALELLTLPALWPGCRDDVTDSLRFLASLCDGPFIFRRTSHPRLEKQHGEGLHAAFKHGFLQIEADLARGRIGVGMRFHDGRDTDSLTLAGHRVAFTAGGRRHVVLARDVADGGGIRHADGALELTHHQDLTFPAGWGRTRRLGRLAVTARFRADAMAFDAEIALEVDPGAEVSDVSLILGQDRLSHGRNGVTYDTLHGLRADGSVLAAVAGRAEQALPGSAGAGYWCIAQGAALRGFALGLHSLPREAGRVAALHLAPGAPGQLGWVGAEHGFPGPQAGATLVAAERRLLTSGGFYDQVADYAVLLGDAARMGDGRLTDFSISYDYGAELVAFARCVRLLDGRAGRADPALREEARALYDRMLDVYQARMLEAEAWRPGSVFSRPLGFVVQSLCDMVLATGEARYRTALDRATEALLGFEREQRDVAGDPSSVFVMGHGGAAVPYLDCHAAVLLGLVRAVPLLSSAALRGRAVAAVDRGVNAFALATVAVDFYGPKRQDVIAVDFQVPEGRRMLDGYWNFAAALALRAFRALQRSPDPELQKVAARHEDRIALMRGVVLLRFRHSLRERGDAVEVRTGILSEETNSETQPWVALAMARQSGDW
ncbi:hypothetical protein [Falsiroseomonas sp. CW058]|uniref:hypothetical protein n=1 Tax=Falsiroseomonas sp. CW058 TaxID=3388664 RepID=UPI003D31B1F2